jgi:hypothetical protein
MRARHMRFAGKPKAWLVKYWGFKAFFRTVIKSRRCGSRQRKK